MNSSSMFQSLSTSKAQLVGTIPPNSFIWPNPSFSESYSHNLLSVLEEG